MYQVLNCELCAKTPLKLTYEHLQLQNFSGGYTIGPPWREGLKPPLPQSPRAPSAPAGALRAPRLRGPRTPMSGLGGNLLQ